MIRSKKTKGIIRNKTEILILNKQARRKKASRFAKQNLSGLAELYSPSSPSPLKSPFAIQLQRMPTMSTLPPDWVDKFEECLSIIRSLDDLKKQILTQQSRRLSSVKTSQEKQAQRKIYDLTTLATKKIKQCEKILEQIKKDGSSSESQADQKTRKNVIVSLAVSIQQKTKQLRGQQKAFVEHRQNLQKSTKVSFLELAAEKAFENDYFEQDLDDEEQLELELKVSQQRNQQILKIVQSIHQLNDLYKQLNNLVIVQGSLLDRIDYNIQQSVVHVKKADQTLGRVDQRQKKSKCACRMIALLLVIVVILGIVLIVKWSK